MLKATVLSLLSSAALLSSPAHAAITEAPKLDNVYWVVMQTCNDPVSNTRTITKEHTTLFTKMTSYEIPTDSPSYSSDVNVYVIGTVNMTGQNATPVQDGLMLIRKKAYGVNSFVGKLGLIDSAGAMGAFSNVGLIYSDEGPSGMFSIGQRIANGNKGILGNSLCKDGEVDTVWMYPRGGTAKK